ncbi:unnamed protein product [Phytomonas sp. EM1]|nr:unnamed protein product [Phytomonas sp. EM1]|eukprot:CCW63930.1 unnamed protein product [Phytomonas sp. isolate EM1]
MLVKHRLLFKAAGVSFTRTLRTPFKAPVSSPAVGGGGDTATTTPDCGSSNSPRTPNSNDSADRDAKEPAIRKIMERLAVVDRQLAEGEEITRRLQQRQGMIESHLADLEAASNQMRGEMVEVQRVLGDVVLKQQNIDFLVKQTERVVLRVQSQVEEATSRTAPPSTAPKDAAMGAVRSDLTTASITPKATAMSEEEIMNKLQKMVDDAFSAWQASHPRPSCGPPASSDGPSPVEPCEPSWQAPAKHLEAHVSDGESPLQSIKSRMENFELRLQEIQAEISLQHVENAAIQNLHTINSQYHSRIVQTRHPSDSNVVGSEAEANLVNAELASILRSAGVLPFRDPSGLLRIASQRVLVYDIPPNVGAAEVRELCAIAVGDARGVISCIVRRLATPVAPPSTARVEANPAKEPTEAVDGSSAPRKTKEATRYRSQQPRAPSTVKSNDTVSPGGEVPALRRAFEVTFASAQLAACAIKKLNRTTLRLSAKQSPQIITVEPVVSADILAAVKRLGGDEKVPNSSSTPSEMSGNK